MSRRVLAVTAPVGTAHVLTVTDDAPMESSKTPYDPAAIAAARDRDRWARTSMQRYERRVAAAETAIPAAQAKRDRKAAKRAAEQARAAHA
ncbi:hypothetical protein BjapCC829_21770 [Bradyrhizobium barranii]|uniref:Uncharacterized protein n=1 Tax=Bradyrhizobium barranii TaxID=2992140 RepID=A0ABY3R0X1_9BRAD|nr:hypothetical protein [Bradyrhizobium japonicum]UFW91021.1 hypothetical protein BjapCC829_21770 [Bradyrhizobium japonicum]